MDHPQTVLADLVRHVSANELPLVVTLSTRGGQPLLQAKLNEDLLRVLGDALRKRG